MNDSHSKIKQINGGRDPIKLIQQFITERSFNHEECLQNKTADTARWVLEVNDDFYIELILENIKSLSDTSIYIGVNVATVPLKKTQDFLVTALETADALVGVKISVVGHYLVMSTALNMSNITLELLDMHYTLIMEQSEWFRETLTKAYLS